MGGEKSESAPATSCRNLTLWPPFRDFLLIRPSSSPKLTAGMGTGAGAPPGPARWKKDESLDAAFAALALFAAAACALAASHFLSRGTCPRTDLCCSAAAAAAARSNAACCAPVP